MHLFSAADGKIRMEMTADGKLRPHQYYHRLDLNSTDGKSRMHKLPSAAKYEDFVPMVKYDHVNIYHRLHFHIADGNSRMHHIPAAAKQTFADGKLRNAKQLRTWMQSQFSFP